MQRFGVKLLDLGPNRVKVLAIVHPVSNLSPSRLRDAIDNGPVIVLDELMRGDAIDLATKLKELGADVDVFLSVDDCC